MSLRDDIAAAHADDTLDEDYRRLAVYRLKTRALLAVIARRLVGRPYTHQGATYLIHEVMEGPQHQLIFGVEINGTRHTVNIINPPTLPRAPTGNERRDLRQAAIEMLEGLGL